MTLFWAFFIGILLGTIVGIFVTSLVVVAKHADERAVDNVDILLDDTFGGFDKRV